MMGDVSLVPFEEVHLSLVLTWVNDPFVREAIGTVWPVSMVQHREWYGALQSDRSRLCLVMLDAESSAPVGMIGLNGIDLIYRNAELWLYVGDEKARRRRLGGSAVEQLLRRAFETIGLHRVFVHVFEYNEPARRFFKSCGFQEEGRLRDAAFKRGRFWDKHVMGILDREFAEHRPQPVAPGTA
jgi:diamine N-acetyltransferase